MALARGIEPRLHVFQTGVQPLHQARMEEGPGIEPSHALSNVSPFSRRMNAIARRLPNTKLGEPENRTLSRPFERVIVFETSTDHSVLLSKLADQEGLEPPQPFG